MAFPKTHWKQLLVLICDKEFSLWNSNPGECNESRQHMDNMKQLKMYPGCRKSLELLTARMCLTSRNLHSTDK